MSPPSLLQVSRPVAAVLEIWIVLGVQQRRCRRQVCSWLPPPCGIWRSCMECILPRCRRQVCSRLPAKSPPCREIWIVPGVQGGGNLRQI